MNKPSTEKQSISTLSHAGQSQKLRFLTFTALFAALITILTAYIGHIPIGTGYIHFGDCLIYLAAAMLPLPYAIAATAIGGGLADLLTSPLWAPATILIKSLLVLLFSSKQPKLLTPRNIAACAGGLVISCTGYFIARLIIYGLNGASFLATLITSVGGNIIQSVGSAIFFVIFATFLDKLGFKQRIYN